MISTGAHPNKIRRAATSIHQWEGENPAEARCLARQLSHTNPRGMSLWPENKVLTWRTTINPARMFVKFQGPFTKSLTILKEEGCPGAAKLLGMIKKPYDYKTVQLPRTKVYFEAVLQVNGKDVEIDGFRLFSSLLTLRGEPHRLTIARVCRFDATPEIKNGSIMSLWRSNIPRNDYENGRMLFLNHKVIIETSLRQALRERPHEAALIDITEHLLKGWPVEEALEKAGTDSGLETLTALKLIVEKKKPAPGDPLYDPTRRMAYSIT